jgi:hypothetical protein
MEKQINLLKKLKALAERGIGGEAENAQNLFDRLLKKYGLTVEDIEGESTQFYAFKAGGVNAMLLMQIIKRVNYDLKIYDIPPEKVKALNLGGNIATECTVAEYIEIEQMFKAYKNLYKKENAIFYSAFLTANDLLTIPPKKKARTTDDLSPEELEKWKRTQAMASKIKTETIRKQLK